MSVNKYTGRGCPDPEPKPPDVKTSYLREQCYQFTCTLYDPNEINEETRLKTQSQLQTLADLIAGSITKYCNLILRDAMLQVKLDNEQEYKK